MSLGNGLQAVGASSAIGVPAALTDGDLASTWAEARGGSGRGEFVRLQASVDLPLRALNLLARGPSSSVDETKGTAPRILWLAARGQLYRLHWDHDAWSTPGRWFRVEFPEPLVTDCLAIVLERAHDEGRDARVTLSELSVETELSGMSAQRLVGRLSTPGTEGEAAAAALHNSGELGLQATLAAFGALDVLGRQRALEVLADAPCDRVAPALTSLLDSEVDAERVQAIRRLSACGPAIEARLEQLFSVPAAEVNVARLAALASK